MIKEGGKGEKEGREGEKGGRRRETLCQRGIQEAGCSLAQDGNEHNQQKVPTFQLTGPAITGPTITGPTITGPAMTCPAMTCPAITCPVIIRM